MNVISAYMLINKAYPSTGGPFTVRFYDETGALIQTDANVPQGGKASCTLLDGTFNSENLYFKGWNPAPDRVVQNMDCYPVYGDYIISHEEIHDSWETICQDAGAHYPLGAYKSLVIPNPSARSGLGYNFWVSPNERQYVEDRPCDGFAMDMVKVAEAEDGSTSTWLSTGVMKFNAYTNSVYQNVNSAIWIWKLAWNVKCGLVDWGNSYARKYLNDLFILDLPLSLRTHIKTVTKTYKGYSRAGQSSGTGNSIVHKTSLDKIWIPSTKELYTALDVYQQNIDLDSAVEEFGIDYSLVYQPSYIVNDSINVNTRTSMINGGDGNEPSNVVFRSKDPATIDRTDPYNVQGVLYAPFGFCL